MLRTLDDLTNGPSRQAPQSPSFAVSRTSVEIFFPFEQVQESWRPLLCLHIFNEYVCHVRLHRVSLLSQVECIEEALRIANGSMAGGHCKVWAFRFEGAHVLDLFRHYPSDLMESFISTVI